jgi:hypothetical protein
VILIIDDDLANEILNKETSELILWGLNFSIETSRKEKGCSHEQGSFMKSRDPYFRPYHDEWIIFFGH